MSLLHTFTSGALVAAALLAVPLPAATRTWTGGGAANGFADPANWGGTAPVTGDNLLFPGTVASNALDVINDLGSTTFGQLRFDFQGYSVSGSTLRLGSGGIFIPDGAGSGAWATIRTSILATADLNLRAASGRSLVVEAPYQLDPGGHLVVVTQGSVALGANLTGTGTVSAADGSLFLIGPSNFVGPLIIHNFGKITLSLPGSLGTNSSPVSVRAGGILTFLASASDTISRDIDLHAGGTIRVDPGNASASVTLTGSLSLNSGGAAVFECHPFNLPAVVIDTRLTGRILGAGDLIKRGPDPLTLGGTAANTFSGSLRVEGGLLLLDKPPGITAVPSGVALSASGSGALLRLNAAEQIGDNCVVTLGQNAIFDIAQSSETISELVLGTATVNGSSGLLSLGKITCFADLGPSYIQAPLRMIGAAPEIIADGSQTSFFFDLVFTKNLIGNPGIPLRKSGAGAASLLGYSGGGTLDIVGGTLAVGPTDPSPVALSNGGTISGSGPVATITAGTGGGRIEPGFANIGPLFSGSVTLNAQSSFAPKLRSAAVSDVLSVTGTVTLGGATLAPTLSPPVDFKLAEPIVILQNDGTEPIGGTFAGLAEGAELTVGSYIFKISYVGGSGNDVTLTLVDLNVPATSRVWTGLGATTGTGDPQNWNPVGVPQPGERLVFPANLPPQRRIVTDTITGLEFYDSLSILDGGYQISGDGIALRSGIIAVPPAGTEIVFSRAIVFARSSGVLHTGGGILRLQPGGSGTIDLNGKSLNLLVEQPAAELHLGVDGSPVTTLSGSGTIDKLGLGTVVARTPNAHVGPLNIHFGTWDSLLPSALGQTGSGNGTSISVDGTLILGQANGPGFTVGEDIALEGTIRLLCAGNALIQLQGALSLATADRTIDVPAGTAQISTSISGAGGIKKTGAGRLRLTGLTSNTFNGRVFATAGTVELQKNPGLIAVPGDVVSVGAQIEVSASEQINGNVSVTGANLVLATNVTETLPNLTLSGGTVQGGGNQLILDALNVLASGPSTVAIFTPVQAAGTTFTVNVEDGGSSPDLSFQNFLTGPTPSATLLKLGGGTLALSGVTTIPNLDLRNGTLLALNDASTCAVGLNGGALSGVGPVGTITSGLPGGRVEPSSNSGTGILISGSVSWNASTRFAVRLQSNTPGGGHDQLRVGGTVNLNGAVLEVTVLPTFTGPVGTDFVIIENDGAEAVTGTFSGLPQNATFSAGGKTFRVLYNGGSGNDVVLRVAQLGTGITRSWSGNAAGADTSWSNANNWTGNVAPSPGDDLRFPLLANKRTNNNDYPAGTTFNSIRLEGAAYALSGNAITLNDGLTFQYFAGSSSFLLPVTCAQAQSISVFDGGAAVVDPATSYANAGSTLTLHVDSATSTLNVRDLAGSGTIRKTGPGTATLTANTHTGPTEIAAGEVLLDTVATGLGATTGVSVAPGATLRLNNVGATTVAVPFVLGGTLNCANSPVTFSGTFSLDGADAAILQVSGAGIPILSGALSGQSGLRKLGAGEATLSGGSANTFAGGLFVEAGVLRSQKSVASGLAPGPVTIGDGTATAAELRLLSPNQIPTITVVLKGAGALFNLNGQAETIGNLSLTGGTVSTGGATLNFSGTVNTFAAATSAVLNGNLNSTNNSIRFWTIEQGGADDDLLVNGVVNGGSNFVLVKSGEGRVNFVGNSNFPKLRLEYGTAALNGTSTGIAVELGSFGGNQATLTGSGITGPVTTPTVIGGQIAPSGILTISGNPSWNPETRVQIRLLNPTPGTGHDQVAVLGTPTLNGAQLQLFAQPGFVAAFGQVYRILDNDGSSDPVVGTFAGLPEGATVELPGFATFRLSYLGGTGNDITLTVTQVAATGLTRTWDGGGGDNNWLTAANWVGDVAPGPGDALVFPAGAARTINNNNYPAGTTFDSIQFTGNGYALSGNQIVLNNGLRAEAGVGAINFGLPLLLSAGQTFFADAGAVLTLPPGATLDVNGQSLVLQDAIAVGLGAIDLQGVISGAGTLVKTGNGTIFVRGNNTFSGSIEIESGGLQVFHANALGTTATGTNIKPGAFLQLNTTNLVLAEPINLAGSILTTSGSHQLTGAITLSGAGTVACSSPLTLSGAISGAGSLTKSGLADLTIAGSAANTFTGGFFLLDLNTFLQKTAGVVALPGPIAIGDGTGPDELRLLNANQIADGAVVSVNRGGTLNLNSLAETIGGLILTEGTLQTGSATLTLAGDLQCLAADNPSTLNGQILLAGAVGTSRTWLVEDGAAADDLQVSAIVSSNNPTLRKTGPGRARFTATNTLSNMAAAGGGLIVTGANDGTTVLLDGGLVGGTGRLDSILPGVGGTVAPGLSPGVLTLQSKLILNSNSTYAVELNGTAAGSEYDRLNVASSIDLAGAKLAVAVGFTPAVGASFIIVRNSGTDPITGTFAGLPEGGFLSTPGGFIFQISYTSGGTNHITLTRVAGIAPTITSLTVVPGTGPETGLKVITVNAAGTPGIPYQLETSSDLQTWTTEVQQTANASTGILSYRLTRPDTTAKMFQRVRLP